MTRFAFAALAAVSLLTVPAMAETVKMHATMNGASEVPPKQTNGHGTVDATLDTATKKLDYTVSYSDLSGPATAAHFHGPAEPGKNAGVAIPITPPQPSPLKGSATLTDDQMKALMAGEMYVNVHTAANPGGEIRGQVTK
jgi:hypothetical protein